ncbi:MAG TPA: heparinase II/III family protein [Terracidiphilus sp.]|nr:heparinase II/III family protein [Terracidiphilus sp.]
MFLVSSRGCPAMFAHALRLSCILSLLILVSFSALAGAQSNSYPASPLATLRPDHPRLIILDSDMPAIKQAVASDPFIKAWYQQQLAIGEKLLNTPPDVYIIGGPEHTLLATARDMEGRIFTLAGLYRISGDKRFADRATQEMLAATAFPDWYPTHFLDTAEVTAALGIGYDWLYPEISPADRTTIRTAIATKGIDPWIERIRSGESVHHEHNNWNQVCNGGETVGALAIADEEPERAKEILDHAHVAIADIMKLFAPDGGFEEGPGYWNYATSYNVLYIAALDSALGTDFGASDAAGFSTTVNYHIQSTGPTLEYANFGDAEPDVYPSPQVFWFARRFHRPFYAAHERPIVVNTTLNPKQQKESSRFSMLGLMWAALPPVSGNTAQLPRVESFARVAQAYLRSAWDDPDAWYVGFKGGDAHASHGHLDLGSFVLDAFGQRWANDLGPDSYGLPGYFGAQRWSYYRMRTEGHNTLTIDGENQDLDAKSPLTAAGTAGSTLYAIANLDQAYKNKLSAWSRGVEILDNKRVLVQDEITPANAVNVVWNFHTLAAVEIAQDGRSATLTRNGAELHVQIVAPAGARFSTVSTQPVPPQEPNPGLTNLVIPIHQQASPAMIAVLFTASGDKKTPHIRPLAEWK